MTILNINKNDKRIMTGQETNIALVQSCYQAFGTGDISGLFDKMLDAVEWHSKYATGVSLNGTYIGKEQLTELLTKINADITLSSFSPSEFLANAHTVVVLGNEAGTVNKTQKSYQNSWVHVWELAGDKVSSITTYNTVENVLNAFTA